MPHKHLLFRSEAREKVLRGATAIADAVRVTLGPKSRSVLIEKKWGRVFLIGDAASCAKTKQKVPQGYYNLEVMLRNVVRHGGEIGVCGTCMDARGIADPELTDAARRSTLEELTNWVQWADRTLTF